MEDQAKPGKPAAPRGAPAAGKAPGSRRIFEIYKRGQGYYTRMGTAIGGGVIVLAGMNYLYQQLGVVYDPERTWTLYLRYGLPVAFGVVLGLALLWVAGLNRRCGDFFIATEGEMKKVSWSSRREIIGSTKVVILFTVILAALLFCVDILFMLFFSTIKVLRVQPEVLRRIFGL